MDFSSAVRQIEHVYRWFILSVRPEVAYPPALARLIRAYNSRSMPPRVLYLGDSVVERVSREDSDQRPLGQMLIDALAPRYSGVYISGSAYQPQVFYYLLRTLEKMRRKPEIVILPINMRCFSPQWHLRPEWQFEKLIGILTHYLKNPRIARSIALTKGFDDEISDSQVNEFLNTSISYPMTDFSRIGDFIDLIATTPDAEEEIRFRKKQILIFHYLYSLERNHPKMVMLKNTLDYLIGSGVKTFVYVTPVNVQAGERFVGPAFSQYLEANLQVVAAGLSAYTASGRVVFADWCARFASDRFFEKDLATEHLNQSGRLELATLICNMLFVA